MKRVLLILLLFPSLAFAQINKDQIKGYFENGDIPNESHYGALIDFIGQKVDTIQGKGLSTEDFTTVYKNYIDNLPTEIDGKAAATHSHDDRYYTKAKADSIHSQLTSGAAALGIVYIDTDTTINGWDLQSNTKYIGSNGAIVTVNDEINMGGMVINGDSNIVIQGVIFDLNTNNDTGQGNADPSNFATAITIRDASNIIIEKCTFTNSNRQNADPDWTLHAIEAQNADVLHVVNNKSFGCQFKLDGGTGSLTNVFFDNNFVSECTQMGVSAVVQPAGADVLIRNISITNNTFTSIDNHAVYLGNDNGAGSYTGSVTMENINVTGNHIYGLAYLNSSQNSKGILVNLTKDSRRINISENEIVGASGNTSVQGININTASQDVANDSLGHTITVINNKIHDTGGASGGFSIFLTEVENFQIRGNLISEGKGLRLLNCVDGQVFGNQEGKNVGSMFRFDTSTGIISDKRYTDDAEAIADGLSSGDFYYKANAGYVAVGGSLGATLSQEEVEDYTGAQFNHANHNNVTATYDDASGEIRLTADVSAAPSGDSYIDQSYRSVKMYEDSLLLGYSVGSNMQDSIDYATLDQTGKTLLELKALFPDVEEVQLADNLTDFAKGGTGTGRDSIGVSVDYAVVYQMLRDGYSIFIPKQTTLVPTNQVSVREGGNIIGEVDRDDANGSRFIRPNNCNCHIVVNDRYRDDPDWDSDGDWHLSGKLENFTILGNHENNDTGSGVVIKNWGETFQINNVRSLQNPEHGIYVVGKVAPINFYNPSTSGNDSTGIMFRLERTNNQIKEIAIYSPSGDNNHEGLIGIDMSYASVTITNIKTERNQKYVVNVMNGNGLRMNMIGGGTQGFDFIEGGSGADVDAIVRLDYNSGDVGFRRPYVIASGVIFDDYPNAVFDDVLDQRFSVSNNEDWVTWHYSPRVANIYKPQQRDYGLIEMGSWPFTSFGTAMPFYTAGQLYTLDSGNIYLNAYTDWPEGMKNYVKVNQTTQPTVTVAGSVGGTDISYTGDAFASDTFQVWEISYWGTDGWKINIK